MKKIKSLIYRITENILNSLGYSLIHKQILTGLPADIDLIIDVGVADGTHFLLDQYKNKPFLLIEPNKKYHEQLLKLEEKFDSILIKSALGSKVGSATMIMDDLASSFLSRKDKDSSSLDRVEVEVTTLDNVCEKLNIQSKYDNILLKIDTEGCELEVLKGAEKILKSLKIDTIILEIRTNFIDTYNPSELITFLFNYGYQWHNILKVAHRKGGVSYVDILFKKN